MMQTDIVAVGVVVEHGRVLISKRKEGKHLAGMWEFPGGKVEALEDPREALRRELREELGIETIVGDVLEVTFHRYDDVGRALLLLFFEARRSPDSPELHARDVADFAWVAGEELREEHFPPADAVMLRRLRTRLRGAPVASTGIDD